MTTHMKSLVFVAAIAILPVACGTSGSPTGPDTTLEAGLSSQRFAPGVPPSDPQPAPEPNDPNYPNDPNDPNVPGPVPAPAETDPAAETHPAPETDPKPETNPNEGSRPLPSSRPSSPAPPPAPSADVVVPDSAEAIPAPPVSDPGSIPTGAPTTAVPPPAPYPQPVPAPPNDTNTCAAASIEILPVSTIAETNGDQFVAVLRDSSGMAIEDKSCESLVWTAEGSTVGARLSIVVGQDSRSVTVVGATGPYKLGASAPNGIRVSITIGGSL